MKGSVQWSAVQSKAKLSEFCFQWDSNLAPHDPKSEALTTRPPIHCQVFQGWKIPLTSASKILRQGEWDFQNFLHSFFNFGIKMKHLDHKGK